MLCVLTTHPIQYQVPLWRAIVEDGRVPLEVWYLTDHGARHTLDVGFGKEFAWDIPLREGYRHDFLRVNRNWVIGPGKLAGVRLRENLRDRIRPNGVHVVWAQGWQVMAYWQGIMQAKSAGATVWLRGETNDLAPQGRWLKRWIKRVALGGLFRRVDQFLYIGSANRRFYKRFGVADHRLHHAPYCVDNDRFARERAEHRANRAAIRAEWNIPENAWCALFCGKFIPKKHPIDLVRAAALAEVAVSGRPIHLLFAGTGALGAEARSLCSVAYDGERIVVPAPARAGNGKPRASFLGFVNQGSIARAYAAADCLVLPSDTGETWGLVVNEAMAAGLPCAVSSACGCAEDLVRPVDAALVFPSGDLDAMAQSINKARSGAIPGETAWRRRVEQFSFARTVDTVARLYTGAAHRVASK